MAQDDNQLKESEQSDADIRQQGGDVVHGPRPSKETGGPSGPEPTRYGDWERKGRCIDF